MATKVIFSDENWKKTPHITGLRSSFPAAKIVLFIAFDKIFDGIIVWVGWINSADFGNLSAARGGAGACSNGSRGVIGGGGPTNDDTVDYIPIGTLTATATDFGELSQARRDTAAVSGD